MDLKMLFLTRPNKYFIPQILAGIVLIIVLLLGFRVASQKSPWNDEIYSQVASVETLSYGEIILGRINEGNACPLFYFGQKAISDLMQYRTPLEWRVKAKLWGFDRFEDRIVLRILPVIFMSLAVWLIFSYFANYYSLPTALFSLFLSLSTMMLLQFWAEARPYGLWIFLTTVQVFLFLRIIAGKNTFQRLFLSLIVVHFLLSFTVVVSVVQIAVVSALLWIYGVREKEKYVFLSLMPVLIALTYYLITPKYTFELAFTVDQYLRANISRDRFYIVGLFLLSLLVSRMRSPAIRDALPALGVLAGAVAGVCALLLFFSFKQTPGAQFPVSEKYFIFLAPIGIISVTIFVDALIRSVNSWWLKAALLIMIASLVVPRSIKIITQFLKQYPNLFS